MHYKLVSVLFVDSGTSFWQILLWNMYWNLEKLWNQKLSLACLYCSHTSLSSVYLFQPSIKYSINIWKIKYSVNSLTWYDYKGANLLSGKHTLTTKFNEFHFEIWEALVITINTALGQNLKKYWTVFLWTCFHQQPFIWCISQSYKTTQHKNKKCKNQGWHKGYLKNCYTYSCLP